MAARRDSEKQGGRWRSAIRLTLLIALVLLANLAGAWLIETLDLDMELSAENADLFDRMILISIVLYALLIAIPFVPGIEIGIALMVMFGPVVAAKVYIATVAGLMLAFLVGRFVPQRWLTGAFLAVGLKRAAVMMRDMEHRSRAERLALLTESAPAGFLPFLLRHRYIALAIALNIPGNALIGGGGGLAMLAGLSRLYSTPAALATFLAAVTPIPMAVLLFGADVMAS